MPVSARKAYGPGGSIVESKFQRQVNYYFGENIMHSNLYKIAYTDFFLIS